MASLESLIATLNTATPSLSALVAALRGFKNGDLSSGRLTLSGANLVLSPFRGNVLAINGTLQEIPDAGVLLAPTGGILPTTTFRARTSNVATVTTATAHELIPSDWVNVTTMGGSGYNLLAQIASTPTATAFTYASTGANEGSTADTAGKIECDRFIYAHMAGSVMTLTARGKAIAHSRQAGSGIEIATVDPTRTLVGLARIKNDETWLSSDTQQLVRSWANRIPIAGTATFSSNRTTTSTLYVELNVEIRVRFLAWPDEVVTMAAQLQDDNNGVNYNYSVIAVDGVVQSGVKTNNGTITSGGTVTASGLWAEGYHFVSVWARVTGGTGTWRVTDATETCRLRVYG